MKHYFKRAILGILAALFLTLSGGTAAYAQTSEGLEIKPAIVENNVSPGDTYQFTVSVKNISGASKTFFLTTQDIKGLNEQGLPIFAPVGESTGFELSSWIVLPYQSVVFGPGETKSLSFSAKIPLNASPGSHFGGIFLTDEPVTQKTSGASIALRVGPILSLRIAGDIRESARLRELSTSKLIYGSPTVEFNAKVENTGNVLVRPNGLIQITNMFGKAVQSVAVNESAAPVFPGSERIFSTQWVYDGFAFGRYQAVISLAYGDDERKTISGTTSFWILPLIPIVIIIGSLLVAILAMYTLMRLYLKRKLREMGVSSTKSSDTDFYGRKYQQSNSRLMVVSIVIAMACIGILVLLFIMFA